MKKRLFSATESDKNVEPASVFGDYKLNTSTWSPPMPTHKEKLKNNCLLSIVHDAALNVFCNLGRGHTETVYRDALIVELQSIGAVVASTLGWHLQIDREVVLPIEYAGRNVGSKRLDLLLRFKYREAGEWTRHVVELKAVASSLGAAHLHQTLAYMRLIHATSAMLINFDQRDKPLQSVLDAKRANTVHSIADLQQQSATEIEFFAVGA